MKDELDNYFQGTRGGRGEVCRSNSLHSIPEHLHDKVLGSQRPGKVDPAEDGTIGPQLSSH